MMVEENLVVQSVIDNIRFTYINESTIHGNGLFAAKQLRKGDLLASLDGQVILWDEYKKDKKAEEWNAIPGNKILVRPYKTKYFFINHSRKPNAKISRECDDRIIKIYLLVDVMEGEEILLDYRDEPLPKDYLMSKGCSYL